MRMGHLRVILIPISFKMRVMAEWQSGHAADCNSVYIGSIPFSDSIKLNYVGNIYTLINKRKKIS